MNGYKLGDVNLPDLPVLNLIREPERPSLPCKNFEIATAWKHPALNGTQFQFQFIMYQ